MKRNVIFIPTTLLLACAACVAILALSNIIFAAEEEVFTAPGEIRFVGKNKVATANGIFKKWAFKDVEYSDAAPGVSSVTIEVDVASLDTAIKKRDDHLRTADFFDVETYPTATLKISKIVARSGTSCSAALDVDMHGVKKSYDNFTFNVAGTGPLAVEGKFELNRSDFKIGAPYKKLNPMSVGEAIPITFSATVPAKS